MERCRCLRWLVGCLGEGWRSCACTTCPDRLPTWTSHTLPPSCPAPAAGHKQWVGVNDWQGLPPTQVALGVRSAELTDWVLDRMTR